MCSEKRKQIANNYSLVDCISQNMISLKETIHRVFIREKATATRLDHYGIALMREREMNPESA